MAYPKLKQGEECAFPERTICNFCDCGKLERCPYMKYNNSKSINDSTRWECRYNKQAQNKDNVQPVTKLGEIKEGNTEEQKQ